MQLGRLQIFNNWSPYMVADPDNVWLGLEYFCNEPTAMVDDRMRKSGFAIGRGMEKIGIIESADVLDRMWSGCRRLIPLISATYDRFDEILNYVEGSKICILWAAMACISTTTRTTRC